MAAMYSLVRQGALLSVFLVADAAGSRVQDEGIPLSSYGAICEKASIWTELKTDTSADEIMTIDWGKITAEASHQIQAYTTNINDAQHRIQSLNKLIEEALQKEKTVPATDAEIDGLITKATEPYGGMAKETMCGEKVDRKLDRSVRSKLRLAYDASVDKMGEDAKAFFQGAAKSLETSTFMDRCASLLGGETYCTSLCGEMRSAAAKHATTGAVTKSSELIDEKNRLLATVSINQKNKEVCEEAMTELANLQAVVSSGTELINVRFKAVRRARGDLRDAEDGLMDIMDNLAEKETQLQEVEKELDANKEEVAAAIESLQAKKKAETDLNGQVKAADDALKVLDQKLAEASNAQTSVTNLIKALAKLMTKMWLYFDDAALAPMRNHGINKDLDPTPYFHKDIKSISAAGPLNTALEGLDAYCTKEALPAFKAVKDVDMTPLCETGDVPSMKKSIYATVESKITDVLQLIAEAKSWTDPYKGQKDITEKLVKEYQQAGELEGLRDIVGVYQHSQFFHYLQGWKKDGAYLLLIAQLKAHIDSLGDKITELQAELAKLKELAEAAAAARDAAEKNLKEAQEALDASDKDQAALAEAVRLVQEEQAQAEKDLAELRARLAAAEAALEEARKALEESHAMATKGSALLETKIQEALHRFGHADQALLEKMAALKSS